MSASLPPQSVDTPNGFEARLQQRNIAIQQNALGTVPTNAIQEPHGAIPNTPLAASTVSFILGGLFSPAFLAFALGALGVLPGPCYQLGFFAAAWAGFHWLEFAVTAGWNLEKCSTDCKRSIQLSRISQLIP